MRHLISLHKTHYKAMSSQEVFKDREIEFNYLVSAYELPPKDIAQYLTIIRDNITERKALIHDLIDNYPYAECLLVLSNVLIELKKK